MRVSQLEQLYRDSVGRLKEQKKRQERERLERERRRVREEQRVLYEKKLQDMQEQWKKESRNEAQARRRELWLIQKEIERITEQAVFLKKQLDRMSEKTEDGET